MAKLIMWNLMTLDGFVEGPGRDISWHLDVWGEELERIGHILEKICEDGNDAFVLPRCITNDGKEFRNTELFTFDGDKIR